MHRRLGAVLVGFLAVVSLACQPQPPGPPRTRTIHGSFVMGILTADGNDRYTLIDQKPGFVVGAPASNTAGNLRVAIIPNASPVATDQQSCVTWDGPLAGNIQPGISLRIRSTRSRTKAIMVTNNILFSYRTGFNVHLAVSTADPELDHVGGLTLPDAVGPNPFRPAPPPWRMCARAVGSQVELKVWALDQVPAEPAWGDPTYGGTVAVPDGWVYPGQPGFYAGHLKAGETTTFRDGAVEALASPAA